MKSMARLTAVSVFALLLIVPAAFAQTPEYSTLPVAEPLDVGGTILQPGTYTIRVLPSFADRNKVQVTSPDGDKVYATVLTVPHQLEPNEEVPNTTFVYYPAGEGAPQALRTWFAPDPASQGGHDIVYEESRAKQLARLAKSRVVSYRETLADNSDLYVVTPEAKVETYVYVPPPPMTSSTTVQIAESTPVSMPRTAGKLPLVALLGLLSIAAAVVVRFARGA